MGRDRVVVLPYGVHRVVGPALQDPDVLAQVLPDAEGPTGPVQDDRPAARVGVERGERVPQLLAQWRVEGVEAVRPVERERDHAVRTVYQ